MNSNTRPDITLALDLRSDERVVIIGDAADYDPEWIVLGAGVHEDVVGPQTVVVVDRVALSHTAIASIVSAAPRMLAFVIGTGLDGAVYEKQVRRVLTAMYPWNEIYTFSTNFGKVVAICSSTAPAPYDRDKIIDVRPQVQA